MRRRHCHPISMLRHHAESSACELCMRRGEFEEARECCRHVLTFLEASLQHVPWHPALSLEPGGAEVELERPLSQVGRPREAHGQASEA